MIRSFADPETQRIWNSERSRKLPFDIQQTARRKLRQLHRITRLHDLRIPSDNRFEQLKSHEPLRYSIRINDQWRITFNWSDGGAENVRIEDYHRG
jgi:toxin HigB-1